MFAYIQAQTYTKCRFVKLHIWYPIKFSKNYILKFTYRSKLLVKTFYEIIYLLMLGLSNLE